MNLETLARILYVFDYDPILIFKGTRILFDIEKEFGKYWQIFGDNGEEVELYDENRLNKITAIIFIWTKLEEILKQKRKSYKEREDEKSIDYQALLAKWHFLWIYGYILKQHYSGSLDNIFKRVANGKFFEKESTFIENWFPRINMRLAEILEENYMTLEKDKDSKNIKGFNFKNWLRSGSAFSIIQNRFKRVLIEDYPLGF